MLGFKPSAEIRRLSNLLGPDFQYLSPSWKNRHWVRFHHVPTGLEFVHIPAGEVSVGLSEDEAAVAIRLQATWEDYEPSEDSFSDMRPVRRVTIPEFLISTTVVSAKLAQTAVSLDPDAFRPPFASMQVTSDPAPGWWLKAVDAMTPDEKSEYEVSFAELESHGGKRPGFDDGENPIYLTRDEAEQVCQHFGFEMPSESQGEYVYRAGTKTLFPWGNQLPSDDYLQRIACNFDYEAINSVDEMRNPFGVLSMMLREWCADTYSPNHEDLPLDGSPRRKENADEYVVKAGAGEEWPWRTGWEWYNAMSAVRRGLQRQQPRGFLVLDGPTAALRLVKKL